MRKFTALALLLTFGLTACSSVSEKIPTVKIERKKPKIVKQVSYTAPVVQKAEAAMVCDNDNMRARAADKDKNNDTARVLILEEGNRSSQILADVEVNCRDYFASSQHSKSHAAQATNAVFAKPIASSTHALPGSVPAPNPKPTLPSPVAGEGYFYTIKKGDTLYQIARENCTSVLSIAQLNNIADPTLIDLGQTLRLPTAKCNSRN